MTKNILNIGVPSKGRLRKDVLNIFKKNKLNLISERGERDLLGSIKQCKNNGLRRFLRCQGLQKSIRERQKVTQNPSQQINGFEAWIFIDFGLILASKKQAKIIQNR